MSAVERYETMLHMESPELRWDIKNTGGEAGTTISREAMSATLDTVTTWIGTRLVRRMSEGKSAKHPIVSVRVEFEDDPIEQERIEKARDESHR
jgi:hypothetical protein